jgi:hypothetical protein
VVVRYSNRKATVKEFIPMDSAISNVLRAGQENVIPISPLQCPIYDY